MPRNDEPAAATEWFLAGGRVMGWLSLVVAAAVAVTALVDGPHVPVALGAVLFAVLAYVALLRPRVGIGGTRLLLRHLYSTQEIPLASIGTVRVGRMFEAMVDGRRYASPAVSRSLRKMIRPQPRDPLQDYADFVEDRVHARIGDAKARGDAAGPVVRRWAWPEIALTAAIVLALLVSILLG